MTSRLPSVLSPHSRLQLACLAAIVAWGAMNVVSAADATTRSKIRQRGLPLWTTSRVTGSPEPAPPYRVERLYEQLEIQNPVVMTRIPSTRRWALLELSGRLVDFPIEPAGPAEPHVLCEFRELAPELRQAYGLTFDPKFTENGFVYVCYVMQSGDPDGTRVSRFRMRETDAGWQIDPDSERILITWVAGGHNGGCLKFGPDGFLYITTGDATSPSPPDALDTGQDCSDLLASILRIDVSDTTDEVPYRVPPDNPFVGQPDIRPEIWAFGFRNPWKMSFDSRSGDLWVGDVGWELWEMVYRIERGGNYGWSIVEGPQSVRPEAKLGPTPILPPVTSHSHVESRSVTGGFVYHGTRLPELQGAYVYGDYVTGKLWALKLDSASGQLQWRKEIADSPIQVVAFAEDDRDELVILDYGGGIYRLVPDTEAAANADFPQRLSQTGLFSSLADLVPAPGVFEYTINAEAWSDGAVAHRCLAIPARHRQASAPAASDEHAAFPVGVYDRQDILVGVIRGEWQFPEDTVFVKTLSLPLADGSLRHVETQLLHLDGETWRGYSYLWNAAQTDAALVPSTGTRTAIELASSAAGAGHGELTESEIDRDASAAQRLWKVTSRTECMVCHTNWDAFILGFKPGQLDRDVEFGGVRANQLQILDAVGLVPQPERDSAANSRKFVDPHEPTAALDARARSYLHVNCAHCHRNGGGGTANFELVYSLGVDELKLIGARPTQGSFGMRRAELVAPGAPERSVLYFRMATRGRGRMPHLGSERIDERGLSLVGTWIAQMRPSDATSGAPTLQAQKVGEALERLQQGTAQNDDLQTVLADTVGTLQLLPLLEQNALPAAMRDAVLSQAASSAPPIRDLLERFLPEHLRPRRLGEQIPPESLLSRRGDPAVGRRLYLESSTVQCRNCHRIGTAGRSVGPDLDQVGRRLKRAQILESILNPSRSIEPKYRMYVAESASGRIYSGLLQQQLEDRVILRDIEGHDITLQRDELEQLVPLQKSLMPEMLLRDMTAQEAADLLAFLESLR